MDPIIQINQPAPLFALPTIDGTIHYLEAQRGKILVLNFWSATCPWAEYGDEELLRLLHKWGSKVALWSIASNANETPDLLQSVSKARGLPLLLHDSQQQVADLYGAQTTPHLFLLDSQGILRYHGALNDRSFRKRTPERFYLQQAVEALKAGRLPDPNYVPPYGCTVVRYTN